MKRETELRENTWAAQTSEYPAFYDVKVTAVWRRREHLSQGTNVGDPDPGSGRIRHLHASSGSGSRSGNVYVPSNCVQKDVLNRFLEDLSWFKHIVKVFTIHYVNRINWIRTFSKMDPDPVLDRIRSVLRGRIRIRSKPGRILNTASVHRLYGRTSMRRHARTLIAPCQYWIVSFFTYCE
jgi:hypothetical protein